MEQLSVRDTADRRRDQLQQIGLGGLLAGLLLVAGLIWFDSVSRRLVFALPIEYNEGWNAFHTVRWLRGGPLYLPVGQLPITPNNYPPLSFLIVGSLSALTGAPVVLIGRVLSHLALFVVAGLIGELVWRRTRRALAALLAAALWLLLVTRLAPTYVGMYDPQLLGQCLSLAALSGYLRAGARPSAWRLAELAALCAVAMLIKHNLVAVPATLALLLLWRDRRGLLVFSVVGSAVALAIVGATWLAWGEAFFANLIELDRRTSTARMLEQLQTLMVYNGVAGALLMAPVVWLADAQQRGPLLLYAGVAALCGAFFARGAGVDRNVWFDVFIALALMYGMVAGARTAVRGPWSVALLCLALLWPLAPGSYRLWRQLSRLYAQGMLDRDAAYRADVALLRSIPGPAVFETPLLGYDAGKPFLFDAFGGAQLVKSGRAPEELILAPIRERCFGAIALEIDVDETIADGVTLDMERWTPAILRAVQAHYRLYDPGRARYAYIYLPRTPPDPASDVCAPVVGSLRPE